MREMDMNNLTEDDKVWLRAWNRGGEIPGESGGVEQVLVPGSPPGGETNPANFAPGNGPQDDPFNGEEPPDDYNDWTVPQLQFELGNRDLPKTGNKKDLVARLVEDDESEDGGNG